MINRIVELTKVFLKSSFSFSNLENARIHIKGIIKWGLLFIIVLVGLLSYKILDLLSDVNQEIIFLSILFLVIAFLVILQTLLISINLFFTSRDIEYILPLPVKPIELLVSKFNVLLISIYAVELIFAFVPLIIYGTVTQASILYYLYVIIILVVFPIIPAIIATTIIMIFMRFAKYFKNINRFQNIITFISLILIFAVNFINFGDNIIQEKTITDEQALTTILEANTISENIGKYFFTIKPSISAMINSNSWSGVFKLCQVILLTLISYFIFVFFGGNIYLKGILANVNKVKVSKHIKIIKNKDYKKNRVSIRYIGKEWKMIVRNPIFFAQYVLPTFYIPILLIFIAFTVYKSASAAIGDMINWNEIFLKDIDLNFICIILGIGQIANFMSVSAITSFSREGKNAGFIKYIPLSLYKQFVYKSIPVFILDMIPTVIITFAVSFIFNNFIINQVLITLILASLINIFRINLLQIFDLKKPKLNWDAEYALIRQNSNILISIALLGVIILLLIYFANAFKNLMLINGFFIIACFFIILCTIIHIYVKKNENRLFIKIM